MATKNYMINDKWLDLDKQNIVELQSVDGVLDSLKVNGSEVVDPSGKITITENGSDIDIAQYALADVNVPLPAGKITITENGTDIDIAQYALADVSVEGGGGSSDFSTAEVQLTIPTGVTNVSVYGAFCVDYEEISATDYLVNETGTHTAILYKGKGLITILMGGGRSATVSGNIENIDTNGYIITGDCTITIS